MNWFMLKLIPFEILTIFILTCILNYLFLKWRYVRVIDILERKNDIVQKENVALRVQNKIPIQFNSPKKIIKYLAPNRKEFLQPYILKNIQEREVTDLDIDIGLALHNEGIVYKHVKVNYTPKNDNSFDAYVFCINSDIFDYLKRHPKLIDLNKKDIKKTNKAKQP